MATDKKQYVLSDEKWEELAQTGISRQMLEERDELDNFLGGEKTDYMDFNLRLLGLSFDMYATLQLIGPDDAPLLEIISYNEETPGK